MNQSTSFSELKQIPVFSCLTEQELNFLNSKVALKVIDKGNKVYYSEQEIKFVYVLKKGTVKISRHTSSGKILIKDIIYSNEIFGENVFTSLKKRQDFAEVLNEASIYKIPVDVFMRLVTGNPDLADEVMQIIVERLHALENRIRSFVFDKAKTRIIDFLKRTGKLRGIKIGLDECLINHGLSHKEIALITDTSRQTVARVLGELKKDNIIHFSARKPSKILIRNEFGLS